MKLPLLSFFLFISSWIAFSLFFVKVREGEKKEGDMETLRVFIRVVHWGLTPPLVDPSCPKPFVIVDCNTDLDTVEDVAIRAIGQGHNSVLSMFDVFDCDEHSLVSSWIPLEANKRVGLCVRQVFPRSFLILSRAPLFTPEDIVESVHAVLNRPHLDALARRADEKSKKDNCLRLMEKRSLKIREIEQRQYQVHRLAVLKAHKDEERRVLQKLAAP